MYNTDLPLSAKMDDSGVFLCADHENYINHLRKTTFVMTGTKHKCITHKILLAVRQACICRLI